MYVHLRYMLVDTSRWGEWECEIAVEVGPGIIEDLSVCYPVGVSAVPSLTYEGQHGACDTPASPTSCGVTRSGRGFGGGGDTTPLSPLISYT